MSKKTFIVSVIAVLLVVAVLMIVEGKLVHARRAHEKLTHEKLAHAKHEFAKMDLSKLAQSKLAQEDLENKRDGDDDEDFDAFLECVEGKGGNNDDAWNFLESDAEPDPHVMKCVAGCFYESTNITTNGELNKNKFTEFLALLGIDEEEAVKHAEECKTSLAADVPKSDICKRGEAVDICIKKSIPIYEVWL